MNQSERTLRVALYCQTWAWGVTLWAIYAPESYQRWLQSAGLVMSVAAWALWVEHDRRKR